MEGFKAIRDNRRYPLGAVQTEEGVHFSVVWAGENCRLLLFGKDRKKPEAQVDFLPGAYRRCVECNRSRRLSGYGVLL